MTKFLFLFIAASLAVQNSPAELKIFLFAPATFTNQAPTRDVALFVDANNHIRAREAMAVFTFGFEGNTTSDVNQVRHRFQMLWIDATSVPAQVIYFFAFWDRSNVQDVREPMCWSSLMSEISNAVPFLVDEAKPDPASLSLFDSVPEKLFYSLDASPGSALVIARTRASYGLGVYGPEYGSTLRTFSVFENTRSADHLGNHIV